MDHFSLLSLTLCIDNYSLYCINNTTRKEWTRHESLQVKNRVTHFFSLKKEETSFWRKKKINFLRNNKSLTCLICFLNKHIYIVAQRSTSFFFFPGISKIIWKEIDHTHYAALEKTRSSLPELPCNRLQMKYKSNINRNSWQLEFRKCWRLFCAGDYCSLWKSTFRSWRMGLYFSWLDSSFNTCTMSLTKKYV